MFSVMFASLFVQEGPKDHYIPVQTCPHGDLTALAPALLPPPPETCLNLLTSYPYIWW